jgi:hypothetical protein
MRRSLPKLTTEEAASLSYEEQSAILRAHGIPPVAGGDGEGEGDTGEGEAGGTATAEREGEGGEGEGDQVTLTQAEYEALRKASEEVDRIKRDTAERAKAERKKAAEKAREAGRHEEVIKALEAEVNELRSSLAEREEKERRTTRQARALRLAAAARARNPERVAAIIAQEAPEALDDDRTTELEIKRLLKTDDYLFNAQQPTGRSVAGNGSTTTARTTNEQMNRMIRRAAGRVA